MKRKFVSGLLCATMVGGSLFGSMNVTAEETEAVTETANAEESAADSSETDTDKINPEGEKYKIALSNSYMGNDWRQQMEAIAEYVASQEPYVN